MTNNGQCGRALRVLVVNDDIGATDSVVELLGLEGYQARQALDGASAIRSAQSELPDVLLLYLGLPGMDGCEVARRVQELDGGDKVVIIAVSRRNQDRQILCKAWDAGIYLDLITGTDPELLLSILAECRPLLAQEKAGRTSAGNGQPMMTRRRPSPAGGTK